MNYLRENYKKTVARLRSGVKECEADITDLRVDGLIQRFEFCFDFALKSCREYVNTAGHTNDGTPKSILTKASNIGLIGNLDLWLQIYADRETTNKIYDRAGARLIAEHIQKQYLYEFEILEEKFS